MLKDVNCTDLAGAIKLGLKTMSAVLNKDDRDIPYFTAYAWPDAYLGFSKFHNESHVPGRHLNAMLAAKRAGIPVDLETARKDANAAYFSFSGPAPLPMNRSTPEAERPLFYCEHNNREGMFALNAIRGLLGDEKADSLAREMIDWIDLHYLPGFAWDGKLEEIGVTNAPVAFIAGNARLIGPLVRYWQATAWEPALMLAKTLAEKALMYFPEDGSFDPVRIGTTHVHSITCTTSSLAYLADTTDDAALLARVRAFYDNGMKELHNELGWSFESTDKRTARGEVNNSGDVLETALILGKHFGAAYDEDAERFIRAHILPSQLRDTSFITEPDNPDGKDCKKDIARRLTGAFGFPAPYGHYPKWESEPQGSHRISFNLDIVGGATSSLCEALARCTDYQNETHYVRFWFDRETDYISVKSDYPNGKLSITAKKPGPVRVRIPSWLDRNTVKVRIRDTAEQTAMPIQPGQADTTAATSPSDPADCSFGENTLELPALEPGRTAVLSFALPEREMILSYGDGSLRARLKGDMVTAMENQSMPFTFFPPYLPA